MDTDETGHYVPRKLLKELLDHAIESLNKLCCEHPTARTKQQIEAIGKTVDQVREILKLEMEVQDG